MNHNNINNTAELHLTQKERIYLAIRQMESPSQSDIHKATGIARHLIPDRVLRLIDAGKVAVNGKKIDPDTKREVFVYGVNESLNAG